MTKPLLNILIRTSNRPNYFSRLSENLILQSNQYFDCLVSVDTPESVQYVLEEGLSYIIMPYKYKPSKNLTFPWNLYLNILMDHIAEGWILFMDDDDIYSSSDSLQIIAENLPDENSMLVWQMRFPDGRLVPFHDYIGKLPFTRRQIGMPCFAFHSKWKNRVRFDGQRAGDYRITNQLQKFLKVKWLEMPLVQLGNFGNAGRTLDLKTKSNLKIF